MYILRLMHGEKFKITDDEFKQIAGATGQVFIKSCNSIINTSVISSIYPENETDKIEGKRCQKIGILHDGSRAKKEFGQWFADAGDVPDDKGNYSAVKLDPRYYPEVALDIVATEDEWQEIQKTGKNYYEFLSISDKIKRLENKKGFVKLLE